MSRAKSDFSIDDRVKDFYRAAKEFGDVDPQDINPSLYNLKQVSQRYQSPELIAEGGMKQIYKVYDARARRYLAMALLRDDAPEELYDPFIHEAWLTAQLAHPNIITIHDIGVNAAGRPYFTMDLKEGDSLRELIEKLHDGNREALNDYPLEALLQIFLKICDAVSYAHSINVLHLDLKPANIQIGEFGRVLVCDWGMGKILGAEKDGLELDRQLLNPDLLGSVTLYGEMKGTPGNMAPEQVRKEDGLDVRTDIYGLGSILYSLLTLRRPLSGDVQEILEHTINGSIVPPMNRTPDREVPRALSAVTMKAMHVNPAKRYGSVIDLRTEVHRFLTGYATEAERAGVGKQFMLFYRRNRMFCNAVFCSLILLFGGGAWTFMKVSEARKEAEHTLALYEAGQSELENVSAENAQSIVSLARRLWSNSEFDRAQAILEAALKDNPGNPLLMREMGISYFIMQRFAEALPWLERGHHSDDAVVRLARKYDGLEMDPADVLSLEQMTGLLAGLERHDPLREWVVLGDQRKRFNLNERARVIETHLRLINPGWKGGRFDYDEQSNRLILGGTGLRKLSAVLAGLNLRELDISGSDVSNLWKLQNLAIEHLDVHATQVSEIWPIKRMIYLRELVIHEGQFPANQLNELSDRIAVIERPHP